MTSDRPKYVVVIGGANVDITGVSEAPLRDFDSNPGSIDIACGGVARNVAENLARLGVDSRLITLLGHDRHGEMIIALGRAAGIDMQYVQQSNSAATSTYLAILNDTGEMRTAVADMEIMAQVTPDWLQQYRHVLDGAAIIVVDANLPEATIRWIAEECSGNTIFADTVSSSKAPALKSVVGALHTLKTSTIEVEALTGAPAGNEQELSALADELHEQGLERLFVTRGNHGVFFSTGKTRRSLPPLRERTRVQNASGAGDAFLAGLTYAWLRQFSLEDAARFALAAAEVTLSDRATSSAAISLPAINRLLTQ